MPPIILLFGMPRSGTTWIGKIFDSHPATLYRHEPDSWGLLNGVPLLADPDQADAYRPVIEPFASSLAMMRQTKVSASMPIFPKHYYSLLTFQLRRLSVVGSKLVSRLLGECPAPDFIGPRGLAQTRIVWKSIESAGRLGVIARVLDGSRGFLLLRHPCGYAASVLRGESQKRFTGGTPTSEDYDMFRMLLETRHAQKHDLTLDSLKALSPIERLAWRWALFNEKALEDIEGLPHCMAVRYEDICEHPLETVKQMFSFAGLPWDAQTERFIGSSTSQQNDAYYSVFKDPRKAANRWRESLAPEDVEKVMAIVARTTAGQIYSNSK